MYECGAGTEKAGLAVSESVIRAFTRVAFPGYFQFRIDLTQFLAIASEMHSMRHCNTTYPIDESRDVSPCSCQASRWAISLSFRRAPLENTEPCTQGFTFDLACGAGIRSHTR